MKIKLNIRRRLMLIVLSVSIVTLVILSGLAFFGMHGVGDLALESVNEIGAKTALNSSSALEMQSRKQLDELAVDKADAVDQRLKMLAIEVKKIADEMTHITSNPDLFPPRDVPLPDEVAGNEISFYIQHAEGVDMDALRAEIGLTANIRDFLVRAVESNNMADSMVVASRHNFTLTADDNRGTPIESRRAMPIIYNAVASDWYNLAVTEGRLVFTKARMFIFHKTLGLFCAAPYFDANGEIAGVVCAQASLARIAYIVGEVNLHGDGFSFVLDNFGRVILASNDATHSVDNPSEVMVNLNADLRESENAELADIAARMVNDFRGVTKVTVDGRAYFIAYAPIDETAWSFAVALDEAVINEPIVANERLINDLTQKTVTELDSHTRNIMLFLLAFIIMLLIATAWAGRRLSDHFVEPIHQLSDGVREISSGDLDKKLSIKTGDEIEHLAVCFNAMTAELQTYITNLTRATADKERLATELSVATNIQVSMLPNIFPPFPERKEFELFATMHAAKEVGGDFYDFYLIDDDRLVITIADVSGKGVPAALFMVIAKTILKNFAVSMGSGDDLAAVVTRSNQQLCQNNDEMMFVTAFVAMIDLKTGRMTYVNCGHNPPLVRHGDRFEYLELKKSWALGIDEFVEFEQSELILSPGDAIFMYTDGVTEAMNAAGEQYSEERLIKYLNTLGADVTMEELLAAVADDVSDHVAGAEQSDDITMLALRFNMLDVGAD